MASLKRISRAVLAQLEAERRLAEQPSALSERIRTIMLAREVDRVLARSFDASAAARPEATQAEPEAPAEKAVAPVREAVAATQAEPEAAEPQAAEPVSANPDSEAAEPEAAPAPALRRIGAPSLAARARDLRFRLAVEEETQLERRPNPRAARLAHVARALAVVAPAVLYSNGKRVTQLAPRPGKPKPETPTSQTPKPESPKSEASAPAAAASPASKPEAPKAQATKPETSAPAASAPAAATSPVPKAEPVKFAAPKAEAAKAAPAPDSETPKPETPSAETTGAETTKPEASKPEAAKSKASESEADKLAPAAAMAAVGAEADSPAKEAKDSDKPAARKRRRKWPWLVGAAVALAGAYVGAAAATANTVPQGTVVAGVDVGGVRPATAIPKLEKALGPKTETPVVLTLGDSSAQVDVDPADYGLALDAKATVAKVTGFNLAPSSVLAHLAGGGKLDPVISYDEEALAILIDKLQGQVEGGYVNATVAFEGVNPKVVPASEGLGIDTPATHAALTSGLLEGEGTVRLKPVKMAPPVTEKEAAAALEKLAKPLVAGPVTISFQGKDIEAAPEVLAEAASFPPVNGTPRLELDGKRLAQVVLDTNPEGIVWGQDAKIEIVDHSRVQITPSTEGIGIDEDKLAADVAAAVEDGTRKASAETAVAQARFTTEDAEAMGVKEIVAEIDTPITWEYLRTLNLEAGAAKTTGTLVKPGETFSLLTTLGPIDTAHGFYAAGMIIGGQHKDGVGGGLSQISTNTFNLGYRAGYEDLEHHPHSYYFERYPEGVESTLAVPTLDMRWRNNTPYGAVIDSWVADGYVHSRLWSTKYWNVDIQTSGRRNVVPSRWQTVSSPSCEYSPRGSAGFTVTVTRTVSRDGEEPKTDSNVVTYEADHGIRCAY